MNDNKFLMNKKADTRISLVFFVEIVLVTILIITVYSAVIEKLENRDFYKGEYTMMYAYYTTLLESSPGPMILISDEKINYELNYFVETGNFVGLDDKDEKKIYSFYPFLKASIASDYKKSDLSKPTYFVKHGDSLKVSNLVQR